MTKTFLWDMSVNEPTDHLMCVAGLGRLKFKCCWRIRDLTYSADDDSNSYTTKHNVVSLRFSVRSWYHSGRAGPLVSTHGFHNIAGARDFIRVE
uniref:SFRICE_015322 n=1 Tax=Spodoptera frugiperda TaxID=7108 RepID=A0A2H1WXR4_SPOFR